MYPLTQQMSSIQLCPPSRIAKMTSSGVFVSLAATVCSILWFFWQWSHYLVLDFVCLCPSHPKRLLCMNEYVAKMWIRRSCCCTRKPRFFEQSDHLWTVLRWDWEWIVRFRVEGFVDFVSKGRQFYLRTLHKKQPRRARGEYDASPIVIILLSQVFKS